MTAEQSPESLLSSTERLWVLFKTAAAARKASGTLPDRHQSTDGQG